METTSPVYMCVHGVINHNIKGKDGTVLVWGLNIPTTGTDPEWANTCVKIYAVNLICIRQIYLVSILLEESAILNMVQIF